MNKERRLTFGQEKLCDYLHGKSGSFYNALFEAIFKADTQNLERLSRSFPSEVDAYKSYKHVPGFWEDLEVLYFRAKQ